MAVALVFGGGLFAVRAYKQNRPAPVWVPMPINPELPVAKVDEIVGKLKTDLSDEALLRKVNLAEARAVIDKARDAGQENARPMLMKWLATQETV